MHISSFDASSSLTDIRDQQAIQNIPFITITEKSVWDHFGADKVVLLSPDAKEPLEHLSNEKVRNFCC